MRQHWFAVTRERFKVAAVHSVVGVLVEPVKALLCQFKCALVAGSLVSRGSAVNAKIDAVKLLAIAEGRRNVAVVVESPKEATILLVPHHVLEEVEPLLDVGKKLRLLVRLA